LRFVDIAVAALIGTSAFTGMVVWSPQQGDNASNQSLLQAQLRDALLKLIQDRGFAWLIQTPPQEICAALAGMSNSSVGFDAVLGQYSCFAPPRSPSASLAFRLLPMEVTLEVWSTAGG
jgi:hypothetical protein